MWIVDVVEVMTPSVIDIGLRLYYRRRSLDAAV